MSYLTLWCVTISQWSMETFFLGLWNVHYGNPLGCPWTEFGRHRAAIYTLAGSTEASVTLIQYRRARTVMHIYTLIMFLLMNYKQTLRPYTYIPLTSGLVPNDKPHRTKDKDTHTIPLSLNSMLTELPHLHNNHTKVANIPRNSITAHPSCMFLFLPLQDTFCSFLAGKSLLIWIKWSVSVVHNQSYLKLSEMHLKHVSKVLR